MNLNMKTKDELLDLAKRSNCAKELKELHKSKYMNVRRAVARNSNISTEIANRLVIDPVLNVSYMAYKNPKSNVDKEFCKDSLTDCVLCEKDERQIDCVECENKKKTLLNI